MSFFVAPDGCQIYYERSGVAHGEAVILIHGLAGDLKVWKPQRLEFEAQFQVFAFDLPGHGRSGWKKHYTIENLAEIIKAFLDHLELETAHIVGLSIGSTAALVFAAKYPKSVWSLIIEGPAGGLTSFSNPMAWLKILQLQFTVYSVFLLWAVLGKKTSGKVINWLGKTYKYSAMLTAMEEELDPMALRDYSYSNADAPYKGRLGKITAPVLIIRGVDDQFPKRYAQYIKDEIKTVCLWLEIPLAHHLVSLEKPLEFNLAATAFIHRVRRQDMQANSEQLFGTARSVEQAEGLSALSRPRSSASSRQPFPKP